MAWGWAQHFFIPTYRTVQLHVESWNVCRTSTDGEILLLDPMIEVIVLAAPTVERVRVAVHLAELIQKIIIFQFAFTKKIMDLLDKSKFRKCVWANQCCRQSPYIFKKKQDRVSKKMRKTNYFLGPFLQVNTGPFSLLYPRFIKLWIFIEKVLILD